MHKKKVGLYGGTFDPIHVGHLNLAVSIQEKAGLDEVWFCPALVSPHKEGLSQTAPEIRLEMVKKAVAPFSKFYVLEMELARKGPSYTSETLQLLKKEHKDVDFFLILGDESLPTFSKWHNVEEIVTLVPLLVGRRLKKPPDLSQYGYSNQVLESVSRGLIETPLFEVSATAIRERIKLGLCCHHLLPEGVLKIIHENKLY